MASSQQQEGNDYGDTDTDDLQGGTAEMCRNGQDKRARLHKDSRGFAVTVVIMKTANAWRDFSPGFC